MHHKFKTLIVFTIFMLTAYKTSWAETVTSVNINITTTKQHRDSFQQDDNAWVKMSHGLIPMNAVIGGHQPDSPLYICRVNYKGSLQPGKMLAGKCNIGYGGEELALPNFEILTGRHYQWVDAADGQIPANAVIGGQQQDPSYSGPLYICRSTYEDGVHPGKLIAGKCNIGYGGAEISFAVYQVLTSYKNSTASDRVFPD